MNKFQVQTPEDFHVILVGGGISGICMGKKLNDIGIKSVKFSNSKLSSNFSHVEGTPYLRKTKIWVAPGKEETSEH